MDKTRRVENKKQKIKNGKRNIKKEREKTRGGKRGAYSKQKPQKHLHITDFCQYGQISSKIQICALTDVLCYHL